MFSIVPKRLWSRYAESDENNLCTWNMNSLLIEEGANQMPQLHFSFHRTDGTAGTSTLEPLGDEYVVKIRDREITARLTVAQKSDGALEGKWNTGRGEHTKGLTPCAFYLS